MKCKVHCLILKVEIKVNFKILKDPERKHIDLVKGEFTMCSFVYFYTKEINFCHKNNEINLAIMLNILVPLRIREAP